MIYTTPTDVLKLITLLRPLCLPCFCEPAETDNSQRVRDNDAAQHLKLRERQRLFEEVYQHDVDNYLPSPHLQIDGRKREQLF